jgi:hypothetical protein
MGAPFDDDELEIINEIGINLRCRTIYSNWT